MIKQVIFFLFSTQILSHPVEFFVEKNDQKISFCHGVALNRTTVLSAAHCLASAQAVEGLYPVFIKSKNKFYTIESYKPSIHFLGNLSVEDSDIGLIFLSDPMDFSKSFKIHKTSNGKELIVDNVENLQKGMSGSPLFQVYEGRQYLIGILSRRRASSLIYSLVSKDIILDLSSE